MCRTDAWLKNLRFNAEKSLLEKTDLVLRTSNYSYENVSIVFIICENTVHSLILWKSFFFLQRSKDLYEFPTFSNLCDFFNFKNVFKNLQFTSFNLNCVLNFLRIVKFVIFFVQFSIFFQSNNSIKFYSTLAAGINLLYWKYANTEKRRVKLHL